MFGTTFGHGTLKKYVIYFGTLFDSIRINRFDSEGNVVQNFKVPLHYGPRDKFLARLDANPGMNKPIAMTLPRMSFVMSGLRYDSTRKLSTISKITSSNNAQYQYNPVPYEIDFDLSIMVKNAEDGTYIIEQILPYFTPAFTASLRINQDLGLKYDIPLVIQNIQQQDLYEGSFVERRALIWNLSFQMKGILFGPTKGTASIIKEIDVDFLVPYLPVDQANRTNTSVLENINIKPGLTEDGQPTSNSELSIDHLDINPDDNYGFITEFNGYENE